MKGKCTSVVSMFIVYSNMPGYICSKCGQVASATPGGLIWHLRNRHALVVGQMFTQPVVCGQNGCMRTFRYSSVLLKHIQREHVDIPAMMDVNNDFFDDQNEDVDLVVEDGPMAPAEEMHVELAGQDITRSAAVFLAKMKASSSVVQATVDHVVSETSSLFSNVVGMLKSQTEQYLLSKNIGNEDAAGQNLLNMFEEFENPFQDLQTAHQQQKYFVQSGYFVQPREIPFAIAFHPRNSRHTGHVVQVAKHVTFQYVPLPDLLKCVLESKGFMRTVLEHHPSDDGVLRDFHDGAFCREHNFFSNPNNIRLLLYVDECEITNPLGSKAGLHKIGVIYCTILNLPPKFRSSLCNCFLVALYNAGDVKTYGYEPILQPLINDIKLLEREGLPIVSNVYEGIVLVSVAQITGDNLGVNGILGFVESFVGNHYCRHCKMHRNETRTASIADAQQLRNADNYDQDLHADNATATGVKRPCPLNDIQNFHVTTNYAPDIMHDILEGVGGLEIHLILAHFIIQERLFDLDLLNSRITSFDYSPTDSKNKPSPIALHKLQNPDTASGQTASQMWCLLRYLPLMIGDLVPESHEHFELLLLLLECTDFIFCPEITKEETLFLKHIIKDHHGHFLELYPERNLKPKHHFMTHYPQQMRLLGPLIHFWTMRFEAKHRFFKRLGHIVCNYRNILKTLCNRQQMFLCYNLISGEDLAERDVEIGLALGVYLFEEVYIAKWCQVNGIKYCRNLLVITGKQDDSIPIFHQIVYVIVMEEGVKLITEEWDTVRYDRHTHTYAIKQFSEAPWSVVSIDSLYDYYPYHASKGYKKDDQLSYVVLRHKMY